MATQFAVRVEGECVTIRLYSLDEYQAPEIGGTFSDAGNGGETVDPAEFLAAASVDFGSSSFNYGDEALVLAAAGLEPADYWYDSAADIYLLRDWPAEAPLAARMLG